MTYITLANMYNSELAELFLQFKEKDKILVGRGRRGSAVGVRCSDQTMNVRSPLSELGRTRSDRRLR